MMGLCYCCSLVTLHILGLIAVVIMNYLVTFLVALVGLVVSAPVSRELNAMDKETIEHAHSLISKILEDIPRTHAAWINSKSLNLGDDPAKFQYLKSMIPSPPVLQSISCISSLETCLANMSEGLQLHLNLLTELSKADTLTKTDRLEELEAEINELKDVIEMLQKQAGFAPSKQASDEQSQTLQQDLAKNLTSEYKTEVMAHLTLQQLQGFSCDVLSSIISIRSMTSDMSISENDNTVQLCVKAAEV